MRQLLRGRLQPAGVNQNEIEYVNRINRALDYIDSNLSNSITLNDVAEAANFSRFHFHRIFSAMIGETLNQYIQRLRLEKAATLLVTYPGRSVTDIAFDTGFSGSDTFARSFKKFFNVSASEWRKNMQNVDSNNCKDKSNYQQMCGNNSKEFNKIFSYFDDVDSTIKWRSTMLNTSEINVEVKELPLMTLAYVRHIGPYAGDQDLFGRLYGKLTKWAAPRGVFAQKEFKFINIYHDNPEITDDDKLRMSICVTIPEDMQVDGEIGKMTVEPNRYAVGHFELDVDQYKEAWDFMCGRWMAESGYQPGEGLVFEEMVEDPEKHPEGKHVVNICVPVKPL